jgi:hypothetical protein
MVRAGAGNRLADDMPERYQSRKPQGSLSPTRRRRSAAGRNMLPAKGADIAARVAPARVIRYRRRAVDARFAARPDR